MDYIWVSLHLGGWAPRARIPREYSGNCSAFHGLPGSHRASPWLYSVGQPGSSLTQAQREEPGPTSPWEECLSLQMCLKTATVRLVGSGLREDGDG